MSNYSVQYKGRIVHENISSHTLAVMVLEGQISGLESYARTGRTNWLPVCQMVPVRNEKGEWEIQELSHVRPERPVEVEKLTQLPTTSNSAAPNSPVNIYVNSAASDADDKTPGATPERGTPATMAIVGIVLCAMSIIVGVSGSIAATDTVRKSMYFAGMGLTLLAVLFSAIGVQYATRRILPIVGVALGILGLLVWAGIIVQTWAPIA